MGQRILAENGNFERRKIYGDEIVSELAQSLTRSKRVIWRAIQFARKFPDLGKLPEGKDTNWSRIVQVYLPETKTESKEEIDIRNHAPKLRRCVTCNKWRLEGEKKYLCQCADPAAG